MARHGRELATDWTKGGRDFVDRVAEFVKTQNNRDEIIGTNRARIASLKSQIADWESGEWTPIAGIDPVQAAQSAREEIEKCEEAIAEVGTPLPLDKIDKQLMKDFYGDYTKGGIIAVQAWGKARGVEITAGDAGLLVAIAGGLDHGKTSIRGRVNTCKYVQARTRLAIADMRLIYGAIADVMMEKGIIPPMAFGEKVRAFYAPKQKQSKKVSGDADKVGVITRA